MPKTKDLKKWYFWLDSHWMLLAGSENSCVLLLCADGRQMFQCKMCDRLYKQKKTLQDHQRYECGKEPQYSCSFCPYKAKLKGNFRRHLLIRHAKEASNIVANLQSSLDDLWSELICKVFNVLTLFWIYTNC